MSEAGPPSQLNHSDECLTLTLGRCTLTFRGTAEMTRGAWSLLEIGLPGGESLAGPHRHAGTLEACFVLEGAPTVQLDGQARQLRPGGLLVIPPGVHHAYRNETAQAARFLLLLTPPGHERSYEELASLLVRSPDGRTLTAEQHAHLQTLFDLSVALTPGVSS
ncbi:cupin domain-containing protein [Deinococcus yavapaiensis]|uniref:Cupin type-2 domain-containing protein n=1 Tax=Deinococcus yavapaiensis KR-236 TaxID=694435 RepID=A0A318SCS3_9DEIO|nr:cupin domain-containing protein [Deinococcus yavapaiensis]PYE55194.1 hypothetical protein DES52_10323 [Deinococcus yavapaiensis KR-236]